MSTGRADGPVLTLNNGVEIPALGFGVFQTPPDETIAAVESALSVGGLITGSDILMDGGVTAAYWYGALAPAYA